MPQNDDQSVHHLIPEELPAPNRYARDRSRPSCGKADSIAPATLGHATISHDQSATPEQAPAPSRFVRSRSRQSCGKPDSTVHATLGHVAISHFQSATYSVGDDLWSFESNAHPKKAHAVFYTAHRKHVAMELALSGASSDREHDSQAWDQLLVGLSL